MIWCSHYFQSGFKACENIQWCKNTCYLEVGFKACKIITWVKYKLLDKNSMERLRLRCSDKVFYVTIAGADIESLGLSIHSLIDICTLYHTMVCEQKSYNSNYAKFWAFWQKERLTIFDKALMLFWKTYLHLKQLFDTRLLIWRQLSFSVPKIAVHQPWLTWSDFKKIDRFLAKNCMFCTLSQKSAPFWKSIYIL